METQWETLATELKFAGEREMWDEFYTKRKLSVNVLSRKFGVSPNGVRSRLKALDIKMRKRGGPNGLKVPLTQELLDSIEKIGIPATAKVFGCTAQALYRKLYYKGKMRKREIDRAAAESKPNLA